MSYSLNRIVAPDAYTDGATIAHGVPIKRTIIDVANQAIFWQLADPPGNGVWQGDETFMPPGSRAVLEPHVGIRVRAAIPLAQITPGSNQAVVTLRAIT